jgi:hypothetical protein
MKLAFYGALAGAILALAPNVVRADGLLNSTINAAITLQGQDDNGFYTIDVFTGAISVGSGFNSTYSFFRQNTFAGFSTASDQLTGTIGLSIAADSVTLTFNGQAQPVELTGDFTGLPATITSATETDAGFVNGVSMPLSNSFTATSLTINAFYLGFQPGTSTTQTDTLTFVPASSVAEPSSLFLTGTWLLGVMGIARRKILRFSGRTS